MVYYNIQSNFKYFPFVKFCKNSMERIIQDKTINGATNIGHLPAGNRVYNVVRNKVRDRMLLEGGTG